MINPSQPQQFYVLAEPRKHKARIPKIGFETFSEKYRVAAVPTTHKIPGAHFWYHKQCESFNVACGVAGK